MMLLLVKFSVARPVATPTTACDTYGPYFDALTCLKIIQTRPRNFDSSAQSLTQDFQHTVQGFTDDCCDRSVQALKEARRPTSGTRVFDVEVPLSTTYLMSLQQIGSSDVFIPSGKLVLENPSSMSESKSGFTEVDNKDSQETEHLLCSQQLERRLQRYCGGVYWDQDRGMNIVVGIVVLFLAVVLVIETAEGLLKL
jgi:hypothetical protein